ncbi:unnamed protein product [Caenorhabditis brenneri]
MKIRKSTKSRFPLGKLPLLAIEEVLKAMDTAEKIRLALTSNKMENIVKMMKGKPKLKGEVCLSDEHVVLTISNANEHPIKFCDTTEYFFESGEKTLLCFWEMRKWMGPKDSDKSCSNVLNKLHQIIPCHSLSLYVDIRDLTENLETTLLALTSELKRFNSINLHRLTDWRLSRMIMDSADKNIESCDFEMDFPSNFHHDKAFQFSSISYEDGSWVRTEHLFSLRNSRDVTLYYHNLTPVDINFFVKYWINSDFDMFRTMELDIFSDLFDMETVLKDIVALEVSRFEQTYFLIAAKFQTSREHTVLSIRFFDSELTLHTFSPEEINTHFGLTPESFLKEYKVLRYSKKISELERQLKRVEREKVEIEARIQNLIDEYQNPADEFSNH